MLELVEANHPFMRGMQRHRAREAYLWSHPGGPSRQGPILPGGGETGQACPALQS